MTGATTQGGTLQLVATARVSTLAAFDHAQTWTGTERGDSWGMCQPMLGRGVQGRVHKYPEGNASPFGFVPSKPVLPLTDLLLNWRGLNCAPSFSRNSHRLPVLPRSSRQRVCLVPPGQTRAYSLRLADCSPLLRHTLPVKQLFQSLAYRNHHRSLSNWSSSAGFKTSQKGLQGRGKVIRERGIFSQRGRHD